MNRSGSAVQSLLVWLKIEPGQLLVVVDDADLPLGQIRLRPSGGSGGHNGLRSIIEALGGSEEFARLRIGIGRTAPLGTDITGHVLGPVRAGGTYGGGGSRGDGGGGDGVLPAGRLGGGHESV